MSVRMVMINGREVAIEQSPVHTNVQSCDRFAARCPRPGLFVLRQEWGKRLFGGLCAVGGSLFFVVGLLCLRESAVGLVLAFPGVLMIAFGLWLFGPKYHFRRDAGEWSIRNFGITRKRSLASILAVQVTEGGWYSPDRSPNRTTPGSRFFLYQLNLVLEDPAQARLFVYAYRHLDEVLQTGQLLAEFLDVPLVISNGVAEKSGLPATNDSV